jgi:hypothetical protein
MSTFHCFVAEMVDIIFSGFSWYGRIYSLFRISGRSAETSLVVAQWSTGLGLEGPAQKASSILPMGSSLRPNNCNHCGSMDYAKQDTYVI